MKSSRRVGMAASAAAAVINLVNSMIVSEKAERVNNARKGPGRFTLYTLHKRVERSKVRHQQSPQFMLRQVRRKRRMLTREEAHLPFTAMGHLVLKDGDTLLLNKGFNRRMEARLEKQARRQAVRANRKGKTAGRTILNALRGQEGIT